MQRFYNFWYLSLIRIEYLPEKINNSHKKQLFNGKIGAHEIQIREVDAHVLCFWTLVTDVKCLGSLHIENTKKPVSIELLIYIGLNVAGLFY